MHSQQSPGSHKATHLMSHQTPAAFNEALLSFLTAAVRREEPTYARSCGRGPAVNTPPARVAPTAAAAAGTDASVAEMFDGKQRRMEAVYDRRFRTKRDVGPVSSSAP